MPRQRKSKPLSPDHAALGQAIERRIAEIPWMSQDSIAREAGISQRRVNDFVRGQGNPRFTTLLQLCSGLHLSLEELAARVESLKQSAVS
jgi:DNA-binding phage protein